MYISLKRRQVSFELVWKHLTQLTTLSLFIVMRQIFKAKAKQILRVSVFVIHNRCELKKTHYTLNEAEVIKMVCTFVKGKKKKNKNVSSAKKKKLRKAS